MGKMSGKIMDQPDQTGAAPSTAEPAPLRPLRLLMVEDSATDALLTINHLERAGYALSWRRVETASAMSAALEGAVWDVVIADYSLPQFNGLEALRLLRRRDLDTPFILVSGAIGEETAVEAMRGGAQDYLMKGNLSRLALVLERELAERRTRIEKRQAEDELRQREDYFRALIEEGQDMICVLASDRSVTYASPAVKSILGHEPAAIIGKSSLDFVHPEDRDAVRRLFEEYLATPTVRTKIEVRLRHADGSYRIFETIGRNLISNPSVRGVVINAHDITERKSLEAQFLRAQRMESIGRLAGGIAHDLNNILAPVLMAAPMIRGLLPPAQADMAEMIEHNAKRGADIVRQLLTFARGMGGERVQVQLKHLIRDMVKVARETFPRSVSVESRVSKDLSLVLGDPTQLDQVLMNLCVNARDAMPEGGRLTLSAGNALVGEAQAGFYPGVHPGSFVCLEVADTGQGIPPEILDRIFEPFFTTKPAGQGTGLGLSTCVGIVRSHGGFMDVHSKIGQGAIFQVYLPSVPDTTALAAPPPTGPPADAHGELILVVEDEDDVRRVMRATLTKHGYRVLEARNGAEAIQVYEHHQDVIRLVLTDVMMPVMGGLELVRQLKQKQRALKILVSTGIADPEDPNRAIRELSALGATAVLNKPFRTVELLDAVHALLASPAELAPQG